MPREGHDGGVFAVRFLFRISIHVPREGHDCDSIEVGTEADEFLSTCPVRGTTREEWMCVQTMIFLSTCPVRGTTKRCRRRSPLTSYFYPRAP